MRALHNACWLPTLLPRKVIITLPNLNRALKLYKMIKEGDYDLENDPWPQISESAKDLLRKLLTVDPEERISAKDALEHPWIK